MLLGLFFSGNGMGSCWVMVHRGGRRSMAGGVCVLLACAHVYMRTHVIAYFSTTRPQSCVICCAITFYGGRKVFPSTTDRPQNVVICICHAKWFGNSNWFAEVIQIDLLRKFNWFAEEIHWICIGNSLNLVLYVTQKFLLSTEHTEKADFFSSLKARNLWRKSFLRCCASARNILGR